MSSSSLSPTLPSYNDKITLQVGERRFITRTRTLTEGSGFFSSLLSSPLRNDVQDDGAYFFDADGDTFLHILRYLRNNIFPLFYSAPSGYDYALYYAVLEQARYFEIPELESWIADHGYLRVIRHTVSAEELPNLDAVANPVDADMEIEYHPVWKVVKVYVCPRRIPVHRGRPDACGKACGEARGEADDKFEEEGSWKVVAVKKKTMFHPEEYDAEGGGI
ncbi:hypothetical protein MMC14_007673 [Varicellaria rhodocarpa]|nr:hypothetical protein [Varicellaria rhodocarpa]